MSELKHYGVPGMKWGIRKARKQGVNYTYKSMGQRKYEKKIAKAKTKNTNPSKVEQYQEKLDMFKVRDRNRQTYAQRSSVGKSVVKGLLLGPFGAGNYNRMRSAGFGRVGSFLVSNVVTSTLGMPITIGISKAVENRHARSEAELTKRMKKR